MLIQAKIPTSPLPANICAQVINSVPEQSTFKVSIQLMNVDQESINNRNEYRNASYIEAKPVQTHWLPTDEQLDAAMRYFEEHPETFEQSQERIRKTLLEDCDGLYDEPSVPV